jgi:hypothetical protein
MLREILHLPLSKEVRSISFGSGIRRNHCSELW